MLLLIVLVLSASLVVRVDTVAPNAPVEAGVSIVSGNQVQLTGTAEANSTVKVFDSATQIGTATANSSGAWSLATGALTTGNHSLTAKATDAAGNTGAASAAVVANIPAPSAPAAPKIASFSNDTGVAGDGITSDNTLALAGTAAAGSTVKVFDGATQIGITTAKSDGSWDYITSVLNDAKHMLTAKVTDASGQTAASSLLTVTVDTAAPNAPVEASDSIVNGNQVQLTGTAEANSTLKVYDGTTLVGTTTTNATGNWTVMTSPLSVGAHDLTATATDAAGNTSAVSLPLDPVISENSKSHIVTINGTADAYSEIKVNDGTTSLGTVTTAADGTWSFKTPSAVSNTVHTFTAQEIDSTGHVVASSGSAILGSTRSNTLTSTPGNDYFVGNGSSDTFVFAANFGNDVIKDFGASGRSHDVVQFSKSVFDSFASVLAHATQVGQDVVISADASDSVTLKNTKLSSLDSHDFHFS